MGSRQTSKTPSSRASTTTCFTPKSLSRNCPDKSASAKNSAPDAESQRLSHRVQPGRDRLRHHRRPGNQTPRAINSAPVALNRGRRDCRQKRRVELVISSAYDGERGEMNCQCQEPRCLCSTFSIGRSDNLCPQTDARTAYSTQRSSLEPQVKTTCF
jgi:hypothetical protein